MFDEVLWVQLDEDEFSPGLVLAKTRVPFHFLDLSVRNL